MPKLPSLAGKHLKEQREPIRKPIKSLIPKSIHAALIVGAVFYFVFRVAGEWDLVVSLVTSAAIGFAAWLSVREWGKLRE